MGRRRLPRRQTQTARAEVLKLLGESRLTHQRIADRCGVHVNTVGRWARAAASSQAPHRELHNTTGLAWVKDIPAESVEADLAQLRSENLVLRVERDAYRQALLTLAASMKGG